jgi:hypothetical protein
MLLGLPLFNLSTALIVVVVAMPQQDTVERFSLKGNQPPGKSGPQAILRPLYKMITQRDT